LIVTKNPLLPKVQESSSSRYWVCSPDSEFVEYFFNLTMFLFHCVLLAFCLLLSIANRQCWATFSETITLSLSIYVTVFLALISYVVEQIGSSQEVILFTRIFMFVGGSIVLVSILYVPRLKSIASGVQQSEESVKSSTTQSRQDVNISLFEDEVEMKVSDGIKGLFQSWGWKIRPTMISENGLLYLPDYKNRAHVLSKMMLLDRHKQLPFSFQLVGSKSVYWIKCKDENHYNYWMAILSKQCKQSDEDFAENL
jgi:hypothetical protein